MSAYSIFALLHLCAGVGALTTFWIAALARKGSVRHRLAGKWHLRAMCVVLASAIPLTVLIFWRGSTVLAVFLIYLFVLVGTSIYCGWRAIRDQRDWHRYSGVGFKLLLALNGVSGLAAIVLGAVFMDSLRLVTVVIGVLGIASAWRMTMFLRKKPSPRWWLQEHLTSMIQSGSGAHVAFLFFGLPRLLPALAGTWMQNLAWLAPIALAGVAQAWLSRRYQVAT